MLRTIVITILQEFEGDRTPMGYWISRAKTTFVWGWLAVSKWMSTMKELVIFIR